MVTQNFSRGVFSGTTHTCLGQEANAVGVLSSIQANDIVFSNHRSHGHFLAYGGDPHALFAELMGRSTGVCGGRGGSQHLHWRNFYSNGIQGGIVPIATGMGLAEKCKRTGSIVINFIGDGTLGEGVIYEAFNLASLWQIPILFVLENNHIAQTTPIERALAGSIEGRFLAFNIPVVTLETADVQQIQSISTSLTNEIRKNNSPRALVLNTWRFGPHSKGDDTRSPAEIEDLWEKFDPVKIQASRLEDKIKLTIEAEVEAEISQAYEAALSDPFPAQG